MKKFWGSHSSFTQTKVDKQSSSGRSMVEMLGVLAVIGVLSIVGLAGYRKAMLRYYANEAWDSAMKFKTEMEGWTVMNPDGCPGTIWYCSADATKCSNWCPFERSDLLPTFANGSFNDFYVLVNKSSTEVQFRNIRIKNLCSTILPGGHAADDYFWVQPASSATNNITYKCIRSTKTLEW